MIKNIIVSSGNKHKIQEIKSILNGLPLNVLSKNDVGLEALEIVEDKETLRENAIKKAMAVAEKTEGIVLADDTGLFVDALNGKPGVYSSRYAGEEATYKDNNEKLLKELKDIPKENRKAKFITVIAIILQNKEIITVQGECSGIIGFEPKGEDGFGYDPLFIVDDYNKTFAQLGEKVKNRISHRARALIKLRKELESIVKDEK